MPSVLWSSSHSSGGDAPDLPAAGAASELPGPGWAGAPDAGDASRAQPSHASHACARLAAAGSPRAWPSGCAALQVNGCGGLMAGNANLHRQIDRHKSPHQLQYGKSTERNKALSINVDWQHFYLPWMASCMSL